MVDGGICRKMVDSFRNKCSVKCLIICGFFLVQGITGDTDVCDFETNQCGYVRDNSEIAQWIRNYGPAWMRSTVGTTGPATDHTEGATTGFYMVLLNIPNLYVYNPGDRARITSQCYPASRSVDVTFYYHMYGDGIGQLNVFLVDCSSVLSLGLSVISISGDQGDEWKLAGFSQANVGEFKLVFEAVRGPTNSSDIAIDDIILERTEPNSNTDPQEYFDEADIVCTFESSDACGYQQDQTDDTDMIYNHGSSWLRVVDGSTGPTEDHTNGIDTNFYMIMLNVPGIIDLQPGDTARLISPCYTIGAWMRILFFYHMYGQGMGTLNVYSSDCDSTSADSRFFSISGNQGDEWKEGSSILHAEDGVKFTFEAIRGPEQTSDIAIDDIALFALNEDDITTTTTKRLTTATTKAPTTIEVIQTTTAVKTTTAAATTKTTTMAPATQLKVTTPAATVVQTTSVVGLIIATTEPLVDSCDPNPCQNGGECAASGSPSYVCSCSAQWTGDTCEVEAQAGMATEEDNSGLKTINVVAIVIACIAVLILLTCFVVFGCRGRDSGESKQKQTKKLPPTYERARELQEQLQGRQIHLPKTKQTYQQKQQIMEEEKRRQLEERRRHQEAERLRAQRLRELQEQRERELQDQLEREEEQDEQLYTYTQQISFDSIEENDETPTVRPPLRKQQSSGRKLPQLPTNQNYV